MIDKELFYKFATRLLSDLKDEHLFIDFSAENSHFIRFNNAKVRQAGFVDDAQISLELIKGNRRAQSSFTFEWNIEKALKRATTELAHLREEIKQSPEDPYIVLPKKGNSLDKTQSGDLLPPGLVYEEIIPQFEDTDFVGFYQSGPIVRAHANSGGPLHWFETDKFSIDYSIVGKSERTVKGVYSGSHWNSIEFAANAIDSITLLEKMQKPARKIPKGKHRAYLAPDALSEVMNIISWGGLSESAFRKGECGLRQLKSGKTLSPKIHLSENFESGTSPQFNSKGELSPPQVSLVESGHLKSFLVSTRTAAEYKVKGNAADIYEMPRSLEVLPGNLDEAKAIQELGTGLYLSNLHYLNWSDRTSGRITGMTRYACFWVEGGEIQAPIENARFDDHIYSLLGDNLIDLTNTQKFIPQIETYESRAAGGTTLPGALVDEFTITL